MPIDDNQMTAFNMAVVPHQNDILFGRGSFINDHPGNKRYRSLVAAKKQTFFAARKRKEKRAIAESIMQEVSSLHPHGRFLEEDLSDSPTNQLSANQASSGLHPLILSKVWVPASKDKAIDKILHRLREKKGYTRSIESSSNRSPSSHGSTAIRGEQSQLEQHVSSSLASSLAAAAVSSANSSIANSVSGQESGTPRTTPPNSGTTAGLDALHMVMAMSMLRHNSAGNGVYKKY